MAFMVVNTGRTASRAFYLNLKRQPSILSVSRHSLDFAISEFIVKGSPARLEQLGQDLAALRVAGITTPSLATVFHGVRPRLLYPFIQERNRRLLEIIRDKMSISTVFFPVRDPRDMFRSELNRMLSAFVGDWQFPVNVFGWKKQFALGDLGKSVNIPAVEQCQLKADLKLDLQKLTRDISQRTGKIHSLYNLFSSVFREIHFIDYQQFLDEPEKVFQEMARLGGFTFSDPTLVDTKLNSLANRFLVYNPITFSAFGKRVRYRLELEPVLELCTDWGVYQPLDYDCSDHVSEIERDLKSKVVVGVNVHDLLAFSEFESRILTHPDFLAQLFETVLPIFAINYAALKQFYKNRLYYREAPNDLYQIFFQENQEEIEKMRNAIEKKKGSVFRESLIHNPAVAAGNLP